MLPEECQSSPKQPPATGNSRRPARGGAVDQEVDPKVRGALAMAWQVRKVTIGTVGKAPLPN